jgi:hypothetical protein
MAAKKLSKYSIHVRTVMRLAKKVGVAPKRRFALASKTWSKAQGKPLANWQSIVKKAAKGGSGHSGGSSRRAGSSRRSGTSKRRSGGGGLRGLDAVNSFLGGLGRAKRKKKGRGKPRKQSFAATKVKLARIIKQTGAAEVRLQRIEDRRILTVKEHAEKKAAKAANKAAKQAHKEVSAAQKADFSGYTNRGPSYPQGGASHDDGDRHVRSDGDPDRRGRKGKGKKRSSAKRSSSKSRRGGTKKRVTQATRERMSRAAKARWRRGGKKKGSATKSKGKRKAKKKSSRDYGFSFPHRF